MWLYFEIQAVKVFFVKHPVYAYIIHVILLTSFADVPQVNWMEAFTKQ